MGNQVTTVSEVRAYDPEDGEHYLDLQIEWKLISEKLPASIRYGRFDAPAEGAVYEMVSVTATKSS